MPKIAILKTTEWVDIQEYEDVIRFSANTLTDWTDVTPELLIKLREMARAYNIDIRYGKHRTEALPYWVVIEYSPNFQSTTIEEAKKQLEKDLQKASESKRKEKEQKQKQLEAAKRKELEKTKKKAEKEAKVLESLLKKREQGLI